MKRMLGIWLGMFVVAGSSMVAMGCTSPEEDSCNIKTAGVYVEYEVFEEGDSARTRATFWTGDEPGGTHLSLGECGDTITVNGQTLGSRSGSGITYYESTMAAAESYDFVFSRPDEDPYTSSVSPRTPVVATGPSGTSISRTEAFDVTWEADTGSIDLFIEGDCIDDYPNINGDSVADNGLYTVNAGEIEPKFESDATESCTATVKLTRENSGNLSPSLKGTIKGSAIGRTSFTSTP
jgi:hypothetical protein